MQTTAYVAKLNITGTSMAILAPGFVVAVVGDYTFFEGALLSHELSVLVETNNCVAIKILQVT